ncbi:aminopeptidase N [Ferrimonas lipolytica]|uniref:Aminopeptidase N n=1 Tax=Ferrimonas lipolytica TaxID=2724191 RepID=A0A6H1UD59_9GAMM|nr:aminopeptidase N [Ferrimonas lipolytica]QIZ76559.1 aminopeptidase N [Ferrimonas lipolytica]
MSAMQAQLRTDYQSPQYTIEQLHLDFKLDEHATIVTAVSQVKQLVAATPQLVLDGEHMKLLSVAIDGEVLAQSRYRVIDNQLIIDVDLASFELTVITEIDPANNTALEGLYKSGGAFCTQCEAQGFRRITFFLDRPDVLAKYTTRVEADKAQYPYLLSNGNKIDSGDLDGGRHFAVWQDPFPKPSYLFALVAGDFDLLDDTFITRSGRKVALELFVDRGNLHRGEHAMASLKRAMKWDEERFNLEYDLDIYMIVAVDFFNMGAMENKGLNVFNSKAVLADPQTATDDEYHRIESIIGHEYFHNWTGNRVTCRDWFQLSLKEGLTVFRDQEFSSDLGSPVVNRIDAVNVMRTHQFAEDAGPMAHPIRPEQVLEMNNFYTVTVYDKGSEVIRMMHTLLGEARFQQGMALYFERHDGQAVTCDDFVAAMEDASGVDLTQFRLWYSQSGTPVVKAIESYDADKQQYTLTLTQNTPATPDQTEKQPLHIPVAIELLDSEGKGIELKRDGKVVANILNFVEAEQSWVFDQVSGPVVASLFENFSAPIKLEQNISSQQLALIVANSSSDFSRYDAGQRLFTSEIFAIADAEAERASDTLINALRKVLLDPTRDPALVALMLSLPAESALAQDRNDIDVETIHLTRRAVLAQIGLELEDELLARYRECIASSYQQDAAAVGRRALKNACLFLLAIAGKATTQELCGQQFAQADNMTDRLAALNAMNQAQLPIVKDALATFESQWHQDALVMDKWFSQVAMAPNANVLADIEKAMAHPMFDIANPNRVRALIGAFASGNRNQFHALDGSGYRFLTDNLVKLNTINPQCAARIITPLLGWKELDGERQALIKAQLQRLADLPDLSRDLYEKVTKSLA